MIHKVFSVYDSAAKAYLPPFNAPGRGVAFRAFQDAVLNPESMFNKHPADYCLYELGTFDDSLGTYVLSTSAERVVQARELMPPSTDGKPVVVKPVK